MPFPIRENGVITGSTKWPNHQSKIPIDETTQEWIDFLSGRDRVKTPEEEFDDAIDSNPALKALIEEIEATIPNLRASAKARARGVIPR